jgi:hypothetical protein
MPARCERPGLRFQYPENWTLEDDARAAGDSATVQAPGSGFLTISRHAPTTDPAELAEAALTALREEYPEAEAHEARSSLAGHETIGYDIHFYCLDLTNTAKVRCFSSAEATYVIFGQAEDREFDAIEPVFVAIVLSLLEPG